MRALVVLSVVDVLFCLGQ